MATYKEIRVEHIWNKIIVSRGVYYYSQLKLQKESLATIDAFDVLIYLAAKSYAPATFDETANFYYTNVFGTLNVMRRCRKYQVKIFRPFNIYGIGQRDHFLIQIILNQAKSDRTEFMDSRPKRDFIYIDDIVDAYVKAINYSIKGVEVFNLGSGISTSIKEVTEIISKYINEDFKVVFSEERRKNEVLETVADIKKVRNSLNWKPLVSIEDGISLMINNI